LDSKVPSHEKRTLLDEKLTLLDEKKINGYGLLLSIRKKSLAMA
jgi:hypothetical protein